MQKIFKYPLEFTNIIQEIELPFDSKILDIEFQNAKTEKFPFAEKPYIWVLFDDRYDGRTQKRKLVMYGTGTDINERLIVHIKTIHRKGFVWHFFEVFDDVDKWFARRGK